MADAGLLTPAQTRRAGIAAIIGCALEFYDFMIFAFFAIQIGQAFFPAHSPALSLMGSLAAFWVGFLGRPVGAWVLGRYGDKAGRKPAMLLSMLLMGVSILIMALTPGYAAIGWAAPAIVIAARFVQGFALGGEVGASTVYMVEAVPPQLRGMGASLQVIAQGIGITLGSGVGLALSLAMPAGALAEYGWRIALLLGAGIVPFALAIRRSLPETIGVAEPVSTGTAAPIPLRRIVAAGATVITGCTTTAFVLLYIATFGQTQLGLSVSQAMAVQTGSNLMAILAGALGGLCADRLGRRVAPLAAAAMLVLVSVPAFAWIVESRSALVFAAMTIGLSFLHNVRGASAFAAIAEATDPAIRTRVFGLVYALPVMIFGGATQLSLTWLIEWARTPMAAGWFLVAVNLVGLAGALILPETAPHKQNRRPKPEMAAAA